MNHISQLRIQLNPLRDQLHTHPIYLSLRDKMDIRSFMESHVFEVWDFMFLAKRMKELLEKESPELLKGENERFFTNRFIVYKRAMEDLGARTAGIEHLENLLVSGMPMERAMLESPLPPHITQFLSHTRSVLREDDPIVLAATFAFGREDMLPLMMERIVGKMLAGGDEKMQSLYHFAELYGEEGGKERTRFFLAILAVWCGEDLNQWSKSLCAADDALRARIGLWNGIHESLLSRKAILN